MKRETKSIVVVIIWAIMCASLLADYEMSTGGFAPIVSEAETPEAATEQQVAEAEATPVPVVSVEPQLPVFETVAGGYGCLPVVTFSAEECASVTATAKINFAGEICTVNIRALPVGTRIVYCKPFVPDPNMAYGATLISLSAAN